MPKVDEIFTYFKIDVAKGEHRNSSSLLLTFNFRSLKTRSIGKAKNT
jgi:hypothetical protein